MKRLRQKAKALQAAADAKGDLQDTTTHYDEIAAGEKAIEILSSGAVSGASEKHLPQLVQKSSALAQLRAEAQNLNQLRVAAYLREQGSKINSRVLSALAMRISEDPFKKEKKMIKDLIVKPMEEANEEAEHKGWCDTELSTNGQTRKEKTEAVETLHTEIDELEASIAQLTEQITELTKAVAEPDAAVATATSIREEEKAKNTATIKDPQDAQTLSVLKDFYAKAAEATPLEQEPEVFDEPNKGLGSENGGVVGMIEVIQSDFARLESETRAAEAEAQKQCDEFMTDPSINKATPTSVLRANSSKGRKAAGLYLSKSLQATT